MKFASMLNCPMEINIAGWRPIWALMNAALGNPAPSTPGASHSFRDPGGCRGPVSEPPPFHLVTDHCLARAGGPDREAQVGPDGWRMGEALARRAADAANLRYESPADPRRARPPSPPRARRGVRGR